LYRGEGEEAQEKDGVNRGGGSGPKRGKWQSSTTALFEAAAIVIERHTSYLL
jgi:hypothetical protein